MSYPEFFEPTSRYMYFVLEWTEVDFFKKQCVTIVTVDSHQVVWKTGFRKNLDFCNVSFFRSVKWICGTLKLISNVSYWFKITSPSSLWLKPKWNKNKKLRETVTNRVWELMKYLEKSFKNTCQGVFFKMLWTRSL